MKKYTLKSLIAAWAVLSATTAFAQAPAHAIPTGPDSVLTAKPNELFNGWKLSPAGRQVGVNAMPMKMALSADGKTIAAVCAGRFDGLALIDVATETTRQWLPLKRSFNGVAFSKDGKHIFVSGGNSTVIHVFDFDGTKATEAKPLKVVEPTDDDSDERNFLAGVAVSPKTGKLYVCNEGTNQIIVVDPSTGKVEGTWATLAHPYTCAIGAGEDYLYVSNWGDRSVSAIDMTSGHQSARISVGVRPNEMAVGPDGRLFVCCAGDNTVHVIQTRGLVSNERANATSEKAPPPEDALEIISTSLYESSPEGSTPDGVAVSPDGKSLFVVNADNNDVMVADLADPKVSRVVGFVPVGWYPTAVLSDGKKLFVANGKGLESAPSVPAKQPDHRKVGGIEFDAPLDILSGSVSVIDPPDPAKLADYTRQVRANSPYTPETMKLSSLPNDSIIPSKVGDPCPIKHVLYIIKENRTYDQVFGDMTDKSGKHIGNGDPKIAMFGNDITPNQHQLAREFALFDNLYCNSEVSVDGHAWCDSAMANDWNQRNWITSYTKHGHLPGNDETEATVSGHLWDACRRAGISYKCYGEGSVFVPSANRGTWSNARNARDPEKAAGWIKDLHDSEATGNLPSFMIMSLGENHTKGTTPGAFTPQSCVASNDQAVGQIVDALSHSKFWNDTAIFIIEDDAQNGPDHVDAHRTAGLVISPYVRRGVVDSTHYTQMSMVRTIELILGLPPLTQYDAAGVPMFNAFTKKPGDAIVYNNIPQKIDLTARNTAKSPGAQASAKMDFDDYDDAPEDELNRVLWLAVKGPDAPYPTPIHRAVFAN
jgi:YVTN family beta-propeller protein